MGNIELKFVHICDKAFLSQDGKLNIIGIFNKIWSNNFPAGHPELFVVISIKGGIGTYENKIVFEQPNKEIIAEARGQIKINEEDGTGNLIAGFRNIILPLEGKYKVKIYINNELKSEEILFVSKP